MIECDFMYRLLNIMYTYNQCYNFCLPARVFTVYCLISIRDEQYLSWNIAKAIYCIIWKYCIWSNIRKISWYFNDICNVWFWPFLAWNWPKTIATHQISCILACNLLNSWNCIKFLSVCDESTVQKSGKWKA